MFAARYFAPRYYAPRYFPKVGAAPVAGTALRSRVHTSIGVGLSIALALGLRALEAMTTK